MSSASAMNPLPTKEVLHMAQMKQSLCQWRSEQKLDEIGLAFIGFELDG